jgi:hypothetical protein
MPKCRQVLCVVRNGSGGTDSAGIALSHRAGAPRFVSTLLLAYRWNVYGRKCASHMRLQLISPRPKCFASLPTAWPRAPAGTPYVCIAAHMSVATDSSAQYSTVHTASLNPSCPNAIERIGDRSVSASLLLALFCLHLIPFGDKYNHHYIGDDFAKFCARRSFQSTK